MLRIAQQWAARAIQTEGPSTLTPPPGYDPNGVLEDRQNAWHEKRSNLAVSLGRQRPDNDLSFGLSVAEYLDAYMDGDVPTKGADDQPITDIDMQNTASALWDAWSGNHSTQ